VNVCACKSFSAILHTKEVYFSFTSLDTPATLSLLLDQSLLLSTLVFTMVLQHSYSFSSNEESFDSRESLLAMDHSNYHLIIADLVRRLQEQVELEQQRVSRHNNTTQNGQIPRRIVPEVEIEGMDVFLGAVANAEAESRISGNDSSSCSSSTTTTTDSSDDDGSVLQMNRGKRRCQFRNRRYVGRHWDPEDELNVDSLRLSRKTMEEKRKSREATSNETVDLVSLESVELCDEGNESVVMMMKDATRSSMSSMTSAMAVVSSTSYSSTPILYGNAAA
jgi:hypothetical protein